MAAPEFGLGTERRRKRIVRLIVAGFAVSVVAIIAAYRWKSPPAEEHHVNPKTLPVNANQRLSDYSFTRSDSGQQVFTVHAARTMAFKNGDETVLNDVWVEVFGHSGLRHDLIKTSQCTYNRTSGKLYSKEPVQIVINATEKDFPSHEADSVTPFASANSGAPIRIETSHVFLVQNGAVAQTNSPVKFTIGPTSGTALGLTYATRAGWMELKKDVVINFVPENHSEDFVPYHIECSRLRYDKDTGRMALAGPVNITKGGSHATSSAGLVYLDPQNHVKEAELTGHVKGSIESRQGPLTVESPRVRAKFAPPALELRTLEAEGSFLGQWMSAGKRMRLTSKDFLVKLAGPKSLPTGGVATGNVRLTATPAKNASSNPAQAGLSATAQDLYASAITFAFASGGRLLKSATTVGGGKLILTPQDAKVGQRIITAEPLVMGFDAMGRFASLRGPSQAKIVFMPDRDAPKGTPPAVSTSNSFDAKFEPKDQSLKGVDQVGNYHYQEADRQAFADRSHYDAVSEVVKLIGSPRVQDDESQTRADSVIMNTRTGRAEGVGHVRSTHLAKDPQAKPGDPVEPTNVVADRMVAQRDSQFVHYEGNVRVWHGTDVVESAAIDIYRAQGRVRSGSRVLTSFLQPGSALPDMKKSAPVTIRADKLEFLEDGRQATYQGNVQMETENTTMTSDHLDVFFSNEGTPESSVVERAVGDGHVVVVQPGRRATGEHSAYFADTGKILMTGGPPTLFDQEKGFTTGQKLTFFIRDDRIFLDGGEESPTFSRHRISQ